LRNRNDALFKTSGKKGFFTHTGYDPIGLLYHEALCCSGNAPTELARVWKYASFVPWTRQKAITRYSTKLADFLKSITGLEEVSFQPNSGAAGEYAGLLVIRKYLESRNEAHRILFSYPRRHMVPIGSCCHGRDEGGSGQL